MNSNSQQMPAERLNGQAAAPAGTAALPLVLEMRGITKRFPGVVALQDVSLDLRPGEVLALMGENGAGKSTLMKILGGAIRPDEGTVLVRGYPVVFHGVSDARRHGIVLIHQELMLAGNLDIAGNIFLGNEPRTAGFILRHKMHADAQALMQRVGLSCPSNTTVRTLTAGQMQMVEIAKALARRPDIIIMDEPTSSLTLTETQRLFEIIDELRDNGASIIYISHRLDEVEHLADRVVVLRDGRRVGEMDRANATRDRIITMMVGRQLSNWFPPATNKPSEEIVLQADDLVVPGAKARVSFAARRGEILGFAGLVGSGRTELMQTIFGITPNRGGAMLLDGQPFAPTSARQAIARGVFLAPEDRKQHGLVLGMSIANNISMPAIGGYGSRFWLHRKVERTVAEQQRTSLNIKAPSIAVTAKSLSGGNQQKVVLAKWLAMKPKVLMLDEPTRGVDVGAKAEIYRQVRALAEQGITILMVSSDMEEVLGLSDRIAIMYSRQLRAVLTRKEATQEKVAAIMTGISPDQLHSEVA